MCLAWKWAICTAHDYFEICDQCLVCKLVGISEPNAGLIIGIFIKCKILSTGIIVHTHTHTHAHRGIRTHKHTDYAKLNLHTKWAAET